MKILIILLFAINLLSCNNSPEKTVATDSAISKTNTADTLQHMIADTASVFYCYIIGIEKIQDSTVLMVDRVDFFSGPNVVEEAKNRHLADTAYDKSGKITDIFVPNDYFIVNDDKTVRNFHLPASSPITMDTEIAGTKSNKINSYDYFSKHYQNSLFLLKVNNKQVESIREVFLP